MSVTSDHRLLPFLLRRPGKGVRVFKGPRGERSAAYLAEVSPWTGRLYDPREEAPHLLQEFTQLPRDPEAYARFASQWGVLGLGRAVPIPEPDDLHPPQIEPKEGEFGTAPIECAADWERVVLELRAVAELHGALLARDHKDLARRVALEDGWLWFGGSLREETARLVEFAGDDQVERLNEWGEELDLGTAPLASVACAECPDGDVARAAWDLVARSVNSRTQHLIGYGLQAVDPRNPDEFRLQLTYRGQLYAWLWLQLAERIATGRPMQRCGGCGDWYYQNPGARRQHGIYCSTRCRVAAWRGRKKAIRLPSSRSTTRRRNP